MSLKLFGFRMSQPTRSVLLLLEANKIPYTLQLVDVFKGENRKPEYTAKFPSALCPAIETMDGFCLAETSAILQFLCESHKLDSWYSGSDSQMRARTSFWLSWHHSNTRLSTTQILHPKLFNKMAGAEDKYKNGQKSFGRTLKFLDVALSKQTFLAAGEHATIADLLILPEIDQQLPEAFGLVDLAPFSNVRRWMTDVKSSVGSDVYNKIFTPVCEAAKPLALKERTWS